jgi:protein-disulfide isomerase
MEDTKNVVEPTVRKRKLLLEDVELEEREVKKLKSVEKIQTTPTRETGENVTVGKEMIDVAVAKAKGKGKEVVIGDGEDGPTDVIVNVESGGKG